MTTLAITTRYPGLPSHGYDLRVASLCREIPGERRLFVVAVDPTSQVPSELADGLFHDVEVSSAPDPRVASALRHWRLSEESFLELSFPRWFDATARQLRAAASRWKARRVVVFGSSVAGIAREAGLGSAVMDVCDSPALTFARQIEHGQRAGRRVSVASRIQLWRLRRAEAGLPSAFRQITTINDADTREIVRLHGRPVHNVHTIPNGINEAFLRRRDDTVPVPRAVAFWGNLGFAPNREAVRFLLRSVYAPYLRDAGVSVCIIGGDAEPWLQQFAAADPQVQLLGFVDDLPTAVSRYPLMVNPMLIGSGMKNKVLEAFGLGLAVVSTRLGVEAFPDAVEGAHFIAADEPRRFADVILALLDDAPRRAALVDAARSLVESRYRWKAIGARFNALLAS